LRHRDHAAGCQLLPFAFWAPQTSAQCPLRRAIRTRYIKTELFASQLNHFRRSRVLISVGCLTPNRFDAKIIQRCAKATACHRQPWYGSEEKLRTVAHFAHANKSCPLRLCAVAGSGLPRACTGRGGASRADAGACAGASPSGASRPERGAGGSPCGASSTGAGAATGALAPGGRVPP